MTKVRVVHRVKGYQALRKDAEIMADLVGRAKAVANEASENGRVSGYNVTPLEQARTRGIVTIGAIGHAHYHNRKNSSLLKSLDAGR